MEHLLPYVLAIRCIIKIEESVKLNMLTEKRIDSRKMTRMLLKSWLPFASLLYVLVTVQSHAGSTVTWDLTGTWGGEHIRLVVTEKGAKVEYDCAFGTIDEPLLPDKDGNFEARGTHVFERGGPRRLGEPPLPQYQAVYRGWTSGKEMRLIVNLPDTGKEVGTFLLRLGCKSILEKCL